MRLDRNTNPDGKGKYALIKLRTDDVRPQLQIPNIVTVPVMASAIDLGSTPDTEFFVIRLKDKYAAVALHAYSAACSKDDPEYSREIQKLAHRAQVHPNKQIPT